MAGFKLTESAIVNEWKQEAWDEATLRERRKNLLKTIDRKYPDRLPAPFREMIEQQESPAILDLWQDAAIDATDFDAVLAALRQ